jgi:hypothetical protein
MYFCLRQRHRHTQHPPVATGGDAHGDQDGAVHHLPSFSYAFVAGIEQQVGCFLQRAMTPGIKPLIELLRAAADLRGRDADLGANQLLQDFDNFAGGNPLDIHLGQRQVHRLLVSATALQGAGVEACSSHFIQRSGPEFTAMDQAKLEAARLVSVDVPSEAEFNLAFAQRHECV